MKPDPIATFLKLTIATMGVLGFGIFFLALMLGIFPVLPSMLAMTIFVSAIVVSTQDSLI